ncbi:MAG: ABC transporter permease [Phycisphaerales bacterium]|jgi:putative ABC transport system permease protein|nr:ABC transporter permease [Phycisphaerales bacterium]
MALSDMGIVTRSMRARMFSSVTTIATVAVAVALMLVLLSLKDSSRKAFTRGAGNAHILVSRDASPLASVLNAVFYANPPRAPIEWAKYQEIASLPVLEWAIPTQQGDSYRGMPVLATTREFFERFEPTGGEPWRIVRGRVFEKEMEVVVGSEAAKRAGLSIGDKIALTHGMGGTHVHREFAFEVVGILAPTKSAHDRALFVNLDSTWILHAHDRRLAALGPDAPVTTLADLRDEDRLVTGIYLRVATRPGREASSAIQSVFDQLRRDTSIVVASPSREVGRLFEIIGGIDMLFLGMAAAVLLGSGVSILLALYNSMEQRRRQIAVLRVLGASRGRVFLLVMTESAIIGMLGGVAGCVLALIGLEGATSALAARVGLVIDAGLSARAVVGVLIATTYLAVLAGVVPAVSAYRTSVARKLSPMG